MEVVEPVVGIYCYVGDCTVEVRDSLLKNSLSSTFLLLSSVHVLELAGLCLSLDQDVGASVADELVTVLQQEGELPLHGLQVHVARGG